MNNNKTYGLNKERHRRKQLEAEGYTVIKSAGSLGPFDLFAFLPTHPRGAVRLIQVKSTRQKRKPSYAADIRQINEYKAPSYWSKELHVWWKRQWEVKIF